MLSVKKWDNYSADRLYKRKSENNKTNPSIEQYFRKNKPKFQSIKIKWVWNLKDKILIIIAQKYGFVRNQKYFVMNNVVKKESELVF